MSQNICTVKNCNKFVHGKGYCTNHYYHFRKFGSPLKGIFGQSRPGKINGMYGIHRIGEANPFFGKRHSKKSIEKNSVAHLGNKIWLGKKHTKETKKIFSEQRKGRKLSEEWIKKIKKSILRGENSPFWKEKPTYSAIHIWVRKEKGKPQKCEHCGRTREKAMLHWANKDHKYARKLEDYFSLCVKCHRKYDKKFKKKVEII